MDYKKYINIGTDEKMLQEIEGDAYNIDGNIIARMIGTIVRIISILLGSRKKVHYIITDRRVIHLEFQMMLWVITKSVSAMSLTPRSIKSVGYSSVKEWLIFQTRYFILVSDTGTVFIKFNGTKQSLFDAVSNVTNTLETIQTKTAA